jgi:hypothetical protein
MGNISALALHPTMKTEPRALRAVAALFETLEQRGIRYCHGSNMRLSWHAGPHRPDLLVARETARPSGIS